MCGVPSSPLPQPFFFVLVTCFRGITIRIHISLTNISTSHSSIFNMCTVVLSKWQMRAGGQCSLSSNTLDIVQPDLTNTIGEASGQSNSTCCGETQLSAHHLSISNTPEVITHCAPDIVVADLHTPLIRSGSTLKSDCVLCTPWKQPRITDDYGRACWNSPSLSPPPPPSHPLWPPPPEFTTSDSQMLKCVRFFTIKYDTSGLSECVRYFLFCLKVHGTISKISWSHSKWEIWTGPTHPLTHVRTQSLIAIPYPSALATSPSKS